MTCILLLDYVINNIIARPRLGESCRNIEISNLIAHYEVQSEKGKTRDRVAHFLCHEGYMLVGQRISMCNGNEWSGTLPVCQGIVVGFDNIHYYYHMRYNGVVQAT